MTILERDKKRLYYLTAPRLAYVYCAQCGLMFQKQVNFQGFCSQKCRLDFWNEMHKYKVVTKAVEIREELTKKPL